MDARASVAFHQRVLGLVLVELEHSVLEVELVPLEFAQPPNDDRPRGERSRWKSGRGAARPIKTGAPHLQQSIVRESKRRWTVPYESQQPIEPFVPCSMLVDDLPAELDAIILRMLEVDPRDRFGFALDVAEALRGLIDTSPTLPTRRASYVYSPRLFGRDGVLQEIQNAYSGQSGAAAKTVLLSGNCGAGKTRVLSEWLRHHRTAEARYETTIVCGSAGPHDQPPFSTLEPLLSAIYDRCERGDAAMLEAVRTIPSDAVGVLARLSLASFASGTESWSALSPQLRRAHVFTALERAALVLAGDARLVVVVDDLQWADESSLSFLHHISTQPNDGRVFILGAYRSEQPDALRILIENRRVAVLELAPLSEDATRALVADMLATDAVPELILKRLTESRGNPFFVNEFIRSAVDAGALRRDKMGVWQLSPDSARYKLNPLPESLNDMLRRRLVALDARAGMVVRAAAAIGRELDLNTLSEMTELQDDATTEVVKYLVENRIVTLTGVRRVRFYHDRIRQAAEDWTPPDEREKWRTRFVATRRARSERWREVRRDAPYPHSANANSLLFPPLGPSVGDSDSWTW